MIVEDTRRATVQLTGLSAGDTFSWGEENYLKLSHHSSEVDLANSKDEHYGANLSSGVIIKLRGTEMVEHLKMSVKIVGW